MPALNLYGRFRDFDPLWQFSRTTYFLNISEIREIHAKTDTIGLAPIAAQCIDPDLLNTLETKLNVSCLICIWRLIFTCAVKSVTLMPFQQWPSLLLYQEENITRLKTLFAELND